MVSGLKANGNGFLAVRSGLGRQYRKIDELHNRVIVMVFDRRGKWACVVYRTSNATCHSTKTHPVPYRKKGWIRTDWLKDLAG
jgi:hypothetical protein